MLRIIEKSLSLDFYCDVLEISLWLSSILIIFCYCGTVPCLWISFSPSNSGLCAYSFTETGLIGIIEGLMISYWESLWPKINLKSLFWLYNTYWYKSSCSLLKAFVLFEIEGIRPWRTRADLREWSFWLNGNFVLI